MWGQCRNLSENPIWVIEFNIAVQYCSSINFGYQLNLCQDGELSPQQRKMTAQRRTVSGRLFLNKHYACNSYISDIQLFISETLWILNWGNLFQYIRSFSISQLAIRLFIYTIQTADTLQIRRLVGSTLQLRYQVRTTIRWFVWSAAPSRRHIYSVNLVGRYPPDYAQIEYLISCNFRFYFLQLQDLCFIACIRFSVRK